MEKSLYSKKGEELRAWLRSEREGQGLSMRDLAQKLNTNHQFIGKVELGERRLDVVEYVAYCQALGIDACEGIRHIA